MYAVEPSHGVNGVLQATLKSSDEINKINDAIASTVSQGMDTAVVLLRNRQPLESVFDYVSKFYFSIGLTVDKPDAFTKKKLQICLAQDRLFAPVSILMDTIEKPTREAVGAIFEGVNGYTGA